MFVQGDAFAWESQARLDKAWTLRGELAPGDIRGPLALNEIDFHALVVVWGRRWVGEKDGVRQPLGWEESQYDDFQMGDCTQGQISQR
jgi:hypothetical protein